MIDPENEVYTRIATILRTEYSGVNVSGEYTNAPSSFPHVSFTMSDNTIMRNLTTDTVEMAEIMFEVNVYSNKKSGRKAEAKNIIKTIDDEMFSMNFRRVAYTPVPNMEDATIYRLTARYSGLTDGTFFYRR